MKSWRQWILWFLLFASNFTKFCEMGSTYLKLTNQMVIRQCCVSKWQYFVLDTEYFVKNSAKFLQNLTLSPKDIVLYMIARTMSQNFIYDCIGWKFIFIITPFQQQTLQYDSNGFFSKFHVLHIIFTQRSWFEHFLFVCMCITFYRCCFSFGNLRSQFCLCWWRIVAHIYNFRVATWDFVLVFQSFEWCFYHLALFYYTYN